MPELTFEQFVGGIEDGILSALESTMASMGVKNFGSYSGELDDPNLKKEIAGFARKCPRVLVSYAEGIDMQDPKTSTGGGNPIYFRHDCEFVVLVASNEARSEKARRRGIPGNPGAYAMMGMVRKTLTGLKIWLTLDEDEPPVLLTYKPLMVSGNEFALRVPNVTAYAIHFGTFFRWQSDDRSETGMPLTNLIINVNALGQAQPNPGHLPGVVVDVE